MYWRVCCNQKAKLPSPSAAWGILDSFALGAAWPDSSTTIWPMVFTSTTAPLFPMDKEERDQRGARTPTIPTGRVKGMEVGGVAGRISLPW